MLLTRRALRGWEISQRERVALPGAAAAARARPRPPPAGKTPGEEESPIASCEESSTEIGPVSGGAV